MLDSVTFPKIIPSSEYSAIVIFCDKKEVGRGKTDTIRDSFIQVADPTKKNDGGGEGGVVEDEDEDILFAQVLVNGGQNYQLTQRQGVKDMPNIMLYPRNLTKGSLPIMFPSNAVPNPWNIRRFITKHTGKHYATPGSIPVLDVLARDFMLEPNQSQMTDIFERAKAKFETLALSEAKKELAEYYIRVRMLFILYLIGTLVLPIQREYEKASKNQYGN